MVSTNQENILFYLFILFYFIFLFVFWPFFFLRETLFYVKLSCLLVISFCCRVESQVRLLQIGLKAITLSLGLLLFVYFVVFWSRFFTLLYQNSITCCNFIKNSVQNNFYVCQCSLHSWKFIVRNNNFYFEKFLPVKSQQIIQKWLAMKKKSSIKRFLLNGIRKSY